MQVNLLQYVDDTIYIGEMSLNNVVVIKSILWCFKLASRLKVIFLKSRFGAIGVDGEAIEKYARYLNCRILNLPFMYLGLPNGVNSRKVET